MEASAERNAFGGGRVLAVSMGLSAALSGCSLGSPTLRTDDGGLRGDARASGGDRAHGGDSTVASTGGVATRSMGGATTTGSSGGTPASTGGVTASSGGAGGTLPATGGAAQGGSGGGAGAASGGASNGGSQGSGGATNGGSRGNGGASSGGSQGNGGATSGGRQGSGGSSGSAGAGGSSCAPNACHGCGPLAAGPGSKCGTCGTYVCSADNTSVSCSDPGTTNSCPTWCTTHPAPAGVLAADYQCVDFENGMPAMTVWMPTITGSGNLSRSNALANSLPYSLSTSVAAGSGDSATLAWKGVGASPVKSVSATALIDPVSSPPVVPPSGDIPLLCLDTGGNHTCLYYTVNGTDPGGATGYTGLYIYWVFVGGAAVAGECPLSVTNLTSGVWNTVQLDATLSTGAIALTINGTSAAADCIATFSNDTAAKITVGPSTNSSNAFGWAGYYDNIQVSVRR